MKRFLSLLAALLTISPLAHTVELAGGEPAQVAIAPFYAAQSDSGGNNYSTLVEIRNENEECFNLSAEAVWCRAAGDDRHMVGFELASDLSYRQFGFLKKLAGQPPSN